jgi:hypothetical protein
VVGIGVVVVVVVVEVVPVPVGSHTPVAPDGSHELGVVLGSD